MQCPICKKEVDGRFEICSNCGAMLNRPGANTAYYEEEKARRQAEMPPRPPRPQQPQMQQPPQPQPMQPPVQQAPPQPQIQPPVPPQPPVQPPFPQGNVAAESESKKNTKLIIILAIVGVLIVGIIGIVIAVSNSGSSTSSGGNTYITNNYYINVVNDLLKIQDKYMKDGRVPDDKLDDLLTEQCTYLEEHETQYHITNVEKKDTTIYVEFEDGTDYIYDPSEHYGPAEKEETTKKKETTTKSEKKSSDYTDAAVDLIYNLPDYGYESSDTSQSIELIDLNSDDIPEVLICSHYGKAGIPSINGFYYYDNGKYKMGKLTKTDYSMSSTIPILPKRDSSNNLVFTTFLDTDFDEERPSGSMFWYYYTEDIYSVSYDGKSTLSEKKEHSFSKYRDILDGSGQSESAKNQAWQDYQDEVLEIDSQYTDDNSVYYAVGYGMFGMFSIDDNPMQAYHESVSKDDAKRLVQAYKDNEHEINFYE